MARVYLVDGPACEVPVETVIEKLTPFEKRFYDDPPALEPGDGHPVVVRVEESETNAVFPDEGYYHVPGLTPEDGRRLFGL
jgi:hypothetical protein